MDISVKELKVRLDNGETPIMIDVREPHEYELDHITEMHIPMGTVPEKLEDLQQYKETEVVVICRSGGRSGSIANYLRSQGFTQVRNLTGGMLAWKADIDPNFQV